MLIEIKVITLHGQNIRLLQPTMDSLQTGHVVSLIFTPFMQICIQVNPNLVLEFTVSPIWSQKQMKINK